MGLQALLGRKLGVHTAVVSGNIMTDVGLALVRYDIIFVDTSAPSDLDRRLRLSPGRS